MKKIYTILMLSLLLLAGGQVVAQNGPTGAKASSERRVDTKVPARPSLQQFVQDKTKFILREMKLSAEDSARFAPVYMQLQMEKANLMRSIMEAGRASHKKYRGVPQEQWPDSVKLAMVRAEYKLGVEDATLELHYLGRFEQILTPSQLLSYSRAEKRFKQTFMNGPEHRRRGEKKGEQSTPRP